MVRILLFFSVAYSLILLSCSTALLVNPEIQKVCAFAQFKDRCIQTLLNAPGSKTANAKKLAFIIVNETKIYCQKINGLIEQKLKDKKTIDAIKKPLQGCKEAYTDIAEQIQQTADALEHPSPRSFGDAQTFLYAILTNVDSCEERLPPNKHVLAEAGGNQAFKELISSSLAVVNGVRNGNL